MAAGAPEVPGGCRLVVCLRRLVPAVIMAAKTRMAGALCLLSFATLTVIRSILTGFAEFFLAHNQVACR